MSLPFFMHKYIGRAPQPLPYRENSMSDNKTSGKIGFDQDENKLLMKSNRLVDFIEHEHLQQSNKLKMFIKYFKHSTSSTGVMRNRKILEEVNKGIEVVYNALLTVAKDSSFDTYVENAEMLKSLRGLLNNHGMFGMLLHEFARAFRGVGKSRPNTNHASGVMTPEATMLLDYATHDIYKILQRLLEKVERYVKYKQAHQTLGSKIREKGVIRGSMSHMKKHGIKDFRKKAGANLKHKLGAGPDGKIRSKGSLALGLGLGALAMWTHSGGLAVAGGVILKKRQDRIERERDRYKNRINAVHDYQRKLRTSVHEYKHKMDMHDVESRLAGGGSFRAKKHSEIMLGDNPGGIENFAVTKKNHSYAGSTRGPEMVGLERGDRIQARPVSGRGQSIVDSTSLSPTGEDGPTSQFGAGTGIGKSTTVVSAINKTNLILATMLANQKTGGLASKSSTMFGGMLGAVSGGRAGYKAGNWASDKMGLKKDGFASKMMKHGGAISGAILGHKQGVSSSRMGGLFGTTTGAASGATPVYVTNANEIGGGGGDSTDSVTGKKGGGILSKVGKFAKSKLSSPSVAGEAGEAGEAGGAALGGAGLIAASAAALYGMYSTYQAGTTGSSQPSNVARKVGLVKSSDDIESGTDSRSKWNPLRWAGQGVDPTIEGAATATNFVAGQRNTKLGEGTSDAETDRLQKVSALIDQKNSGALTGDQYKVELAKLGKNFNGQFDKQNKLVDKQIKTVGAISDDISPANSFNANVGDKDESPISGAGIQPPAAPSIIDKVKDFLGFGSPTTPTATTAGTASAKTREATLQAAAQKAGITDPRELAGFMGQMSHESGGFSAMKEIASGDQYQGRMGNNQAGDGDRFKGRGFIQLTGKDNYTDMSKKLGLDLVNHPELAEDPDNASAIAIQYWKDRNLGAKARAGDIEGVSAGINGRNRQTGRANGADDRIARTNAYYSQYANTATPNYSGAALPTYIDAQAAANGTPDVATAVTPNGYPSPTVKSPVSQVPVPSSVRAIPPTAFTNATLERNMISHQENTHTQEKERMEKSVQTAILQGAHNGGGNVNINSRSTGGSGGGKMPITITTGDDSLLGYYNKIVHNS